jgi:SAM-dependent methyltransferase
MILTALCLILICFGGVLLYGAPYVPTLSKQQIIALQMLDLKPGQTLLELGCGDARMLKLAAKQGVKGVGYELNPIVYAVAKINTWRYRSLVTIKLGNFWAVNWPQSDGIYVFLLDRFMKKLNNKVIQQYNNKHVKLVSYSFNIPNKKPTKIQDGLYLYEY